MAGARAAVSTPFDMATTAGTLDKAVRVAVLSVSIHNVRKRAVLRL
jgi:hypothetical protein